MSGGLAIFHRFFMLPVIPNTSIMERSLLSLIWLLFYMLIRLVTGAAQDTACHRLGMLDFWQFCNEYFILPLHFLVNWAPLYSSTLLHGHSVTHNSIKASVWVYKAEGETVWLRERPEKKWREGANQARATDNNLFNAMTSAGRFVLQSPTVTKALNSSKKIRGPKCLGWLVHADRFSRSHLFQLTGSS